MDHVSGGQPDRVSAARNVAASRAYSSSMTLPARMLAVAAAAVAHVPPVVFGVLTPGYSHVSQFISELGAIDAPYGTIVSLGTFLPAGVLMMLACLALTTRVPPTRGARLGLAMVALIGLSWIVAAFAPCDTGCPAEGSPRQAMHNLAGVIGYVGGGVGFLVLAAALRRAGASASRVACTAALGVLLVVGLAFMAAPELAPVRGVLQRVMEVTASAWILATAWRRPV